MSLNVTLYYVCPNGVEEVMINILNPNLMYRIQQNSSDYYSDKADADEEHIRRVRESLVKKTERRHELLDEIKELEAQEKKLAEILTIGGAS